MIWAFCYTKDMHILVSGGAGYIGSHTIVELVKAGFKPVILDSFINADHDVLKHLKEITGKDIPCIEGDFANATLVARAINDYHIQGVVHFAAHKAVGESVAHPLKYYANNVSGFIHLVKVLNEHNIPLVFSSTAAVYGDPATDTVTEDTPCHPVNPYGWSKLMDEIILQSACKADSPMRGIALRYFNVVGAHDSILLGELPKQPPQNLLPIIVQAVAGLREPLPIYGVDYNTPDGTCLRDYIHVVDLAKAHVIALRHLLKQKPGYYDVFNVGTGKPTSVMELINTFERVNNIAVPHHISDRRPGDPPAYYADPHKIYRILGWKAEKTVEDAVSSAWHWQQRLNQTDTANK